MKDMRLVLVLAIFAAALIGLLLIAALREGFRSPAGMQDNAGNASPAATPQNTPSRGDYFIFDVPAGEAPANQTPASWAGHALEIIFRLLLAVLLSSALAFRPRKEGPLFRRSLFVSQTQILLAMVAAALMMIVGDSAARAFGIFAAASLVRFRTNIRDPKEITVLLISLAIGLASGVGRWELGVSLCLFSLVLLWLLEYNETEKIFRSMELTVKTRDPDASLDGLKALFRKLNLDAEVREMEPPNEKSAVGSIVYFLNLPLNLTTDRVSDTILSADPANIEGIQWSKTKAGNIYQ